MDKKDSNTIEEEGSKKTYMPPQVVSDEVFETMALSCTNQGPINCRLGTPANS